MKKLLLSTAIAALSSTSVFADSYNVELGLNYALADNDVFETDIVNLYGEFYFGGVDRSKAPSLESPFLDKSSSIRLDVTQFDVDVPGVDETQDVTLSTRVVFQNDFILEASVTDDEAGDDTILGVGVGTYLTDSMDLVFSYTTADEADSDAFALDLHAVNELAGETYLSYDLGVFYVDQDNEETGLLAGVDYFFNKSFNVGVSAIYTSGDDVDTSLVTFDTAYFFTPSFKAEAFYSVAGIDADGDAFGLSAAVLF